MARIIYDSELDESLRDIKEDVSPDYSAFADEIPPQPPINIKGYGKNLIVETAPGSGKYKTQWGEEASPEYVKDIEDTLASDMSDEQLNAKIRKQVPQRPDDAKLAAWETKLKFRQMALESMKDHGLEVPDPWLEGEKAASEMKRRYYEGISVHDQLLRTEKENTKINFDIDQARKIAVHNAKARIDDYITQIDAHYDKMSTAEAEQIKHERTLREEEAKYKRTRRDKVEDETRKEIIQDIDAERRDIKAQIRKIGIPVDFEDAQKLSKLTAELNTINEKEEEILGGKKAAAPATKKLIGKKNGKNVYDLGNGKWQIGD